MSDIFISYAGEDLETAKVLAASLEERGWSMFWDRTIPVGKTWYEWIGNALNEASCVVVIWSNASIVSDWVRDEAEEGRKRRILMPVVIEDVDPPFGFRGLQAANLTDWNGQTPTLAYNRLITDIEDLIGPPPKLVEEEQRKAEAQAKRKAAEEEARRQAEAEAKRAAEEEAARQRAKTEAEAKRKAEEQDAKRRAEEEAARRRAQEEAEARRQAEEAEARRQAEEAEAARPEPHQNEPNGEPPLGEGTRVVTPLPEGIGPNPLLRAATGLFALVIHLKTVDTLENVSALRRSALEAVKTFERRARALGAENEAALTGRYLVCALIDETVLSTPWGAESAWSSKSLLLSLHKDARGGEGVFDIGQHCAASPQNNLDVLELFYICVCLGFLGKYRFISDGLKQLDQIKQSLVAIIRAQRGEGERELSPHWKGVQDRRPKVSRYVPLWVVPVAAVAFVSIIYWGFNIWLNRSSDEVLADLNRYKDGMVKVALARSERPNSPLPPSVVEKAPNHVAIGLRQHLAGEISAGLLEVVEVGRGAKIVLRHKTLFGPGTANLGGNYPDIVTKIASYLSQYPGPFRVTGHTDKVPINTLRFPSNWQLSKARAEAVAKLMSGPLRGGGRIVTEGLADTEPVATEDTKEAYALNRRVEIIVPADGGSGRSAAAASAEGDRKK